MDVFIELLVTYGGVGMFVAAFLAGSFFPFSSEAVLLGLLAAGGNPGELLICSTVGNTLGSLFNYGVGSLGKEEWLTQRLKVTPEKMEKGKRVVRRYGVWAGLLAWTPLLGSVITIAMGYLRVPIVYGMTTIAIGKYVRYWVLVRAYLAV